LIGNSGDCIRNTGLKVSALTGEGVPELRAEILRHIGGEAGAAEPDLQHLLHRKIKSRFTTGIYFPPSFEFAKTGECSMSILCKKMGWVVILCLSLTAMAQNPFESAKQFSATLVMSGAPAQTHGAQGNMKIYKSGDKMRTDMPGGMGYIIMDLSQHINYMVMNSMCMQMATQTQSNPFAQASDATIERSPAGTDTVDGHACKVENLTVTAHNGKPTKMKVWEAEDLKGFPIKVEMQTDKGPMTVEYKDISFDPPAASLFTHPENCRQVPGGAPH
jgi:hypothetical protein